MPKWRPNCFRGSIYSDPQLTILPGNGYVDDGQDYSDEWKGTLTLTLQKREGCSLGLTIAGGVDKGQKPHVASLRPGSIAYRCDSLMIGDVIVSVNEIQTSGLRHDEIINLLKNARVNVSLEIEYRIPNSGPLSPNIQLKRCEVVLDKEPSGFGFTLRGGMLVDSMRSHPLTVVAIRTGGPADREGSIRVGDQIISVNGYKVTHLSLGETLGLLCQCESSASFTVAYETAIIDAKETATGPLEIEIDRCPGSDLGVSLSTASYNKRPCMCVGYLQPMSVADRSGALHEGDHILSVDGVSVETMSLAEAGQLLKAGAGDSVRLDIVPITHLEHCASREMLTNSCLSQSLSSHSTLHLNSKCAINNNNNSNSYNTNSLSRNHFHHSPSHNSSSGSSGGGGSCSTSGGNSNNISNNSHHLHNFSDNSSSMSIGLSQFGTLNLRKRNTWGQVDNRRAASCMSIASSSTSVLSNANQVGHPETIEVILFADQRGMMGVTLKGGIVPSLPMMQPPTIAFVEPRSAADKCGVLQEGDRILAVNGLETMDRTLEEVNRFLRESRPRCVMLVEFDVTETVIPSSGTFIVKLVKRAGESGITVNASASTKGGPDSLYISDVRRGSVAHRSGSIQAGDKLLAINDVRLDRCTNDDAMHLLELPDDIVKLKLSREDPDEGHEGFVIYTVELQRYGGPLGITISGTEDPCDPIIISELTSNGLAEKTGAIHVGDRLLAVSGDTTKNKPLSEAIRMLQSAGDVVTLKIARPDPALGKDHLTLQPFNLGGCSTPIPSVDSAMESWDSSALDLGSPHHNGLDTGATTPTSNNQLDDCDGDERDNDAGNVMVLAVPQSANNEDSWHQSEPDYLSQSRPYSEVEMNGHDSTQSFSSVHKADSGEEDDNDDTDSNIDDWVKTLEDLDIGSGSEMLRQIGLSLRQRSELNLDQPSRSSSFSNPHRSKSSSRATQGGSSTLKSKRHSGVESFTSSSSTHNSSEIQSSSRIREMNRTATDVYATPMKRGNKPIIAPKPSRFSNGKSASLPPNVSPPSSSSMSQEVSSSSISNSTSLKKETNTKTIFTPSPVQLQKVELEKKGKKEGFGFSLSDGLYERGVFISAVSKDSPADMAGLQQYDKLLQVGKVKIQDQDCSQVVPIIAECGEKLRLILCRNPLLRLSNSMRQEGFLGGNERRPGNSQTTRGRDRFRKGSKS